MIPERIKQTFTADSISEVLDWANIIIVENDIESYDGQMARAVTLNQLLSEPVGYMCVGPMGIPSLCKETDPGAFPVYGIKNHHPETHEAD